MQYWEIEMLQRAQAIPRPARLTGPGYWVMVDPSTGRTVDGPMLASELARRYPRHLDTVNRPDSSG